MPRVIPAATSRRPRGGPRDWPNRPRVATLQMAKVPGKESGDLPNENERPRQRYRREGEIPPKTPRGTKDLNTTVQEISRTKTGGRESPRGTDRKTPT